MKKNIFKGFLSLVTAIGLIPGVIGLNSKTEKAEATSPTIADILPADFPSTTESLPDNVWKNENGKMIYVYNDDLVTGFNISDISTKTVNLDPDTGNYLYVNDSVTYEFVMTDDVLTQIVVSGYTNSGIDYTSYNGTYELPVVKVEIDDDNAGSYVSSGAKDVTNLPLYEISGGEISVYEPSLSLGNHIVEFRYSKSSGGNGYSEAKFSINSDYLFDKLSYSVNGADFVDISSYDSYDEENDKDYHLISGITGSFKLKIQTAEVVHVQDILPDDFPTSAESGWVSESGNKVYKNTGDSNLVFKNNSSVMSFPLNTELAFSNGDYLLNLGPFTVTFTMNDGVLESITYASQISPAYNGTYAPLKISIALVAGAHGSINPTTITELDGSIDYSVDGNVLTIGETTITATPEEGYLFDKWAINGNKITSGTISEDVTITALFVSEVTGAKFFLKIFYIYGFTLSVENDQCITDWVFALENLSNGNVIFDFTLNELVDCVEDFVVDIQDFAKELSYKVDEFFTSFLGGVESYASAGAFALGGVYFAGLLINTVYSVAQTFIFN